MSAETSAKASQGKTPVSICEHSFIMTAAAEVSGGESCRIVAFLLGLATSKAGDKFRFARVAQ
jgi:hypothetical protein